MDREEARLLREEAWQESWKRYDAGIEEARSRRDVEWKERYRKMDEEQLEFNEWKRKRDIIREEVAKKYNAEVEELEKKHEAEK